MIMSVCLSCVYMCASVFAFMLNIRWYQWWCCKQKTSCSNSGLSCYYYIFFFCIDTSSEALPLVSLFVTSETGTVSLAHIYNNHYHNSNDPAPQHSSILTAEAVV